MRKYLIFALIFLVACNFVTTKDKQQTADISGPGGIAINLPKIPSEFYVGQSLEIPVLLENTGVYDVTNAMLIISGYDSANIRIASEDKYEGIDLEGRSAMVPVGEKTTKLFTAESTALNAKEKKITFNIMACYQYKTEASPIVCINPQLALGETVTPGCNFNIAKQSPTQGAPLAVSRVETRYYESKQEVQHDIFVKDVLNTGVVLSPEAYGKPCLSKDPLAKEDQNIVYIEVYMSGEKLKCYKAGVSEETDKFELNTQGETPATRCIAKIDSKQPAFTTPLSIYLTYGYASGKVFSINLKNPYYREE